MRATIVTPTVTSDPTAAARSSARASAATQSRSMTATGPVSPAIVASSTAARSFAFVPNASYTVCTATPASAATSSIVVPA